MPLTWTLYATITGFILGTCLGSFAHVCSVRIPRGISIVHPPSTCPHCHAPIPCYRNLPVITWLLQRGRTACCQKPIPLRYFLWEINFGLLGALTGYCLITDLFHT